MKKTKFDYQISNCKEILEVREVKVIRVVCTIDESRADSDNEFPIRKAELFYNKSGRLIGMNDYYDEDDERVEEALETAREWGYKG